MGSTDGKLYILDAASGATLDTLGGGLGGSSPAVSDGVLYVPSEDGSLYAFGL